MLTWMIPVHTRLKKKTNQQKDELECIGTYNQFKVVRLENILSEDIEKLLDDSILKKKDRNCLSLATYITGQIHTYISLFIQSVW